MKNLTLSILCLVPGALQDQVRLSELLRELGSDSSPIRERATNALQEIGEPALPFLREAARDSDPERKARVLEIISKIEWTEVWGREVGTDLTQEEQRFLKERQYLAWIEALVPPKEWKLEAIPFPEDDPIWSVLEKKLFSGARFTKGPERKGQRGIPEGWTNDFNVRGKDAWLTRLSYWIQATGRQGTEPGLYLLQLRSKQFVLSEKSLAWDASEGMLPCMKDFACAGVRQSLISHPDFTRTFEREGKTTGAFYSFSVDYSTPRKLAHLFIKERWALLDLR